MLNDILAYNIGILEGIATFLTEEPMIYVCGFLLAAIMIKILRQMMNLT